MGACECENPMEFGYEVNTTEKDEKTTSNNNRYKQSNPNISDNNEKNNIVNLESNLYDSSREKKVELLDLKATIFIILILNRIKVNNITEEIWKELTL